MYRGRLRSRRGPATAEASFSDILHLPECMEPILRALPAPDLLNLASSSRACRAATSPSYVQLDINSKAGLRVVLSLHRLGCLHHLRQADLTAATSDSTTGGHLALLAACPKLQSLVLVYECKPAKLWWWGQYIDGVTLQGRIPEYEEDAYERADSVNLRELASAMPVKVHRRLERLEPSDEYDGCYCRRRWLQDPEDCHCAFSDSQEIIRHAKHGQQKDEKPFRCTCYDKVWSWQPGQQAHIYAIV